MNLSDAQADRRARAELLLERETEDLLNRVGLTEALVLGTENVSPADRKKLSGIINRLRGKKHAFTQCMRDLAKHHPEWSDDRRKRTCAVLKALAKPGSTNASEAPVGACAIIDDGVANLLDLADITKLEEAT